MCVVRGRLFALERLQLCETRFAVVGGGGEVFVGGHGCEEALSARRSKANMYMLCKSAALSVSTGD